MLKRKIIISREYFDMKLMMMLLFYFTRRRAVTNFMHWQKQQNLQRNVIDCGKNNFC